MSEEDLEYMLDIYMSSRTIEEYCGEEGHETVKSIKNCGYCGAPVCCPVCCMPEIFEENES